MPLGTAIEEIMTKERELNKPSFVYVASSWRNPIHGEVVDLIRQHGIDCYDFKRDEGAKFHWSEVMPGWHDKVGGSEGLCPADQYLEALQTPRAEEGFMSDYGALKMCQALVLVLPCNRSAHLELGWAVGKNKPTCVLLDNSLHTDNLVTPELMYKMVDKIVTSQTDMINWLLDCVPPRSLLEASRAILASSDEPMDSYQILEGLRKRWPHAFPYVSVLDIADEMRKFYGEPVIKGSDR